MMAVEISLSPSLSSGKPRALFEGQYQRAAGNLASYDVSADGAHFLMQKAVDREVEEINVVLNWFEELRRLVPSK